MFKQVPTTAELFEETMAYRARKIIVNENWNDNTTKILSFQVAANKFRAIYDATIHQCCHEFMEWQHINRLTMPMHFSSNDTCDDYPDIQHKTISMR